MIMHNEFKELWENDSLEEVYEKIDDTWRHGNNMYTVFRIENTDTYYACRYRVSGDGEYHGIRENEFEIFHVKPQKKFVEITEWILQ